MRKIHKGDGETASLSPTVVVEKDIQLKDCPFCGAPPEVEVVEIEGTFEDVACVNTDCLVQPRALGVEGYPSRQTWNTRLDTSRDLWERAKRLAKSRIGVCTNNIPHLTAKDVQVLWDDLDDLFESEFPAPPK